jgi:hypothetical protein
MFEELIWIDDSVFCIFWIGILYNDDCAAALYFVEFKGILIFLCEFNVLAKESYIILSKVFVLVIIFFLDELFLELARSDPGEEF